MPTEAAPSVVLFRAVSHDSGLGTCSTSLLTYDRVLKPECTSPPVPGKFTKSSRVVSFGSSRNTTLSYCRVKLLETVRSSRQAKTSVRSSPANNGRCRFLGLCGTLPKRAL